MAGFEAKDSGELSAVFIFPEDFIGFQGHFPGKKILPGICQIQCAVSLLEKWQGKRAVLKEIVSAKFFSPVLPAEELICRAGNTAEGNGTFILKAFFSRDNKKISEMKLRVQFTPNNAGIGK
jgi:3-hydroxymyristoyl/3-hydroxydecanoyl-(acyl carrier protein) dehydratase